MDIITFAQPVALLLLLGFTLWLLYTRPASKGGQVVETTPEPPAQKICKECKNWSLARGQAEIQANPAFAAACQHLPPWKMSVELEPNPEYQKLLVCATDLERQVETASGEEKARLEEKLDAALTDLHQTPPDIRVEGEHVDDAMYNLDWSHFGACMKHSELRSKDDRCSAWVQKVDGSIGLRVVS